MSTIFDVAPFWRSGIGFDHLFDLLEKANKPENTDTYPPYNIERTGEDAYRLTMAVAGWTPDEITLTAERDVLVVSGKKAFRMAGQRGWRIDRKYQSNRR
jgi:molecular chaperone IbpA